MRVLVVDDMEMGLYVAEEIMTDCGLEVDTASSGYEAVDKIKGGEAYDIIFMDYMMPGMDGIEAAKAIRSLGYARPIVALTGDSEDGADLFMENGFDGFATKPIDAETLAPILSKFACGGQS